MDRDRVEDFDQAVSRIHRKRFATFVIQQAIKLAIFALLVAVAVRVSMTDPDPRPITGCAEINARQREAFLRLNNLTEQQADQLSRWCRKEADVWPFR